MKPAEAYILNQPEPFQSILMHLQILIETNFPEVNLQFKWKLPFYYLENTPFCYLNASKKKGYVDVGFWVSAHLKYNEHLVSDGRKIVKSLRYFTLEDIEEEIFLSVLKEAHEKKEKGFFWKK